MTEELFRADSYLKSCEARVVSVNNGAVVLDRTVFYPTGGGQPGDHGTLRLADGTELAVVEARKGAGATIEHVLAEGVSLPAVGDGVSAEVDWERRFKHMRMHTALHLLCALVDGSITGAQVGAEKSRIDFNIPESPDKQALGEALNALINADHPVLISSITDDELEANPELVRSLSVAPPRGLGTVRVIDVEGVDLQPCGGTHVGSTAEIGAITIGKIENKGKQNRRINIRFES